MAVEIKGKQGIKRARYLADGEGKRLQLARQIAFVPQAEMRRRSRSSMNVRTGGLYGIEKKFIDQGVNNMAMSATLAGGEYDPVGGVNVIGACVQGSGESQRDGTKVTFKEIHINGMVYITAKTAQAAASASLASVHGWLALVQDKQSNSTQLNCEDVYKVPAVGPATKPFRNMEFLQRFKVHAFKEFSVSPVLVYNDAAATGTFGYKPFDFRIDLKNLNVPIDFVAGAGAGTYADFRTNSFHLIGVCDAAATISYNSRVRFLG